MDIDGNNFTQVDREVLDKPTESFYRSLLNEGVLFKGIFDSLLVKKPDRESSRDRVLEMVRLIKDQYRSGDNQLVDSDDLLVRYYREGKVTLKQLCDEIEKTTGYEYAGIKEMVDCTVDDDMYEEPAAWMPIWGFISSFFYQLIEQRCKECRCAEALKLYQDFLFEHCKHESSLLRERDAWLQCGDAEYPDTDEWRSTVSHWLLVKEQMPDNDELARLRLEIARVLYWAALYEHFVMLHYEYAPKETGSSQRALSILLLWMPRVTADQKSLEISVERLFQWLRSEYSTLNVSRLNLENERKSLKEGTWSHLYNELAIQIDNARSTAKPNASNAATQPSTKQVDPDSVRKKVSRWRKNDKALHTWEFAEMLGTDESSVDCFAAAFVNHFSSLQNKALKIGFTPNEVEAEFARYPLYLEAVSYRFNGFKCNGRIQLD